MDLSTPTQSEELPKKPDPFMGFSPVRWLQHRLAKLLGVSAAQRQKTVFAMMVREPSESASY